MWPVVIKISGVTLECCQRYVFNECLSKFNHFYSGTIWLIRENLVVICAKVCTTGFSQANKKMLKRKPITQPPPTSLVSVIKIKDFWILCETIKKRYLRTINCQIVRKRLFRCWWGLVLIVTPLRHDRATPLLSIIFLSLIFLHTGIS